VSTKAPGLTGQQLRLHVIAALKRWANCSDELRDLDAAVGDGDLGITVRSGCEAVSARLESLADPRPADVLKAAGAAFASANPSTMAALVGGALLAGAKALGETESVDRTHAVAVLSAAVDSIATRGKAQLGDKTMLDGLAPSLDKLKAAGESAALEAMIEAAQHGVDETTPLPSKRGRAAWVGERGIGHPDPGATAYVRLLQALRDAITDTQPQAPEGIHE
jgi:dihydroxyacetone kinase phosphoprotein-dependent L subunit